MTDDQGEVPDETMAVARHVAVLWRVMRAALPKEIDVTVVMHGCPGRVAMPPMVMSALPSPAYIRFVMGKVITGLMPAELEDWEKVMESDHLTVRDSEAKFREVAVPEASGTASVRD